MATNRLTDAAVRKAKSGTKPFRMFDGQGMYLEVRPEGGRWWRQRFQYGGKEKLLSLGTYPETSLAEARVRRQQARDLVAKGVDPSLARKAQRQGPAPVPELSFEAVSREFCLSRASGWSEGHSRRWLRRMELDVFPWIGGTQTSSVTVPSLLGVVRRIEARGAIETSHTVMQQCGQVFRFAIATGRADRNPVPDMRDALRPVIVEHMAALTSPSDVATLLKSIDDYHGGPITRIALAFSALVFQRPFNVRAAEWSELDLQSKLWSIPSAKMKRTVQAKTSGRPHLVPLSRQTLGLLDELKPLTGTDRFLFPSLLSSDRPMSENTVNTALRRMGYSMDQMTAHGFRAMARTLLVEELEFPPDVIEAQLAHAKSGPLGSAYDRAEFMQQRRAMMQRWADYLDHLRAAKQDERIPRFG